MNRQEFVALHWAAPQTEVIDAAIELIKSDRETHCCYALGRALQCQCDLEVVPWQIIDLYLQQFREFCRAENNGYLPTWWSMYYTKARKRTRLAALRAFRAACISAANKEQS